MPSVSFLATASGNSQLVAAPTSGQITVLGYQIVNDGGAALAVQLRSGPTTVIARCFVPSTGPGGISCPPVDRASEPYARCAVGDALNVNLSGAGNVAVNVQYEIT